MPFVHVGIDVIALFGVAVREGKRNRKEKQGRETGKRNRKEKASTTARRSSRNRTKHTAVPAACVVVGVSCHEVPVLAVVSLAVDLGFAFSNVDTVLVGMAVQLSLVHDWQKKNNTEKQEQQEQHEQQEQQEQKQRTQEQRENKNKQNRKSHQYDTHILQLNRPLHLNVPFLR